MQTLCAEYAKNTVNVYRVQTLCATYANTDCDCVTSVRTLCAVCADTDCTSMNVFNCTNSTKCYDLKYRCDGSADCTHWDDELDCGKYHRLVLCVCRLLLLHPTVMCGVHTLTAPPHCSVRCCVSADSYCSTLQYCVVYSYYSTPL